MAKFYYVESAEIWHSWLQIHGLATYSRRTWGDVPYCIGGAEMTMLGLVILLLAAAYWLGMHDGLTSRPPVLRGTYDSGEHEDRVEEYGDWR